MSKETQLSIQKLLYVDRTHVTCLIGVTSAIL